jgi:hypothetical protein
MSGMISHLRDGWQRAARRREATRFALAAKQVHGPAILDVGADQAVMLVTQWRLSDLSAFFAHYRGLGVEHFVFFGAHAPPEALERIKKEPCTIIVENGLHVAAPEDHVLRYLTEKYGENRWCLTVKTDELLEFDGQVALGLSGLIRYLNAQGASALMAHRLDMFPKGALGQLAQMDLDKKVAECVYFDFSNLRKLDDLTGYIDANGDPASVYPLVFNRGDVVIPPAPSGPSGAHCADVTAALKSYSSATQIGADRPEAQLFSLAARRWNRAALLVRAGFLQGSDQYSAWITEHKS